METAILTQLKISAIIGGDPPLTQKEIQIIVSVIAGLRKISETGYGNITVTVKPARTRVDTTIQDLII